MIREPTDPDDEVEEVRLSTVIRIPKDQKNQLRILCARQGIAMRDYVETLVRSALCVRALPPGREAMNTRTGKPPSGFDEVRRCKYGCNYHSKSKSGLSQHEETCTYQRSRRAMERAREVEARRRVEAVVLV